MTEIRKGDLIKVEWERDGVHTALTGVAHSKVATNWHTEAGGWLYNEQTLAKVTVLQRALPTETGAVLKSAVLKNGTAAGLLVRCSNGNWFDPAGYRWHTPEEITDFEIGEVQ